MSNEYTVNLSQSIFWKPFYRGGLEVLAHVYYQRPVLNIVTIIRLTNAQQRNTRVFFPSFPAVTRTTADVFRLMFFFPSGVSVERQVLQGSLLGGAVKQSKDGIEDDVPVPRKMSSISRSVLFLVNGKADSSSGLVTFPFVRV